MFSSQARRVRSMTKAVYPVISTQDRLPFYLTGIGISDPEYDVKREKGLSSHQFLFTSSGTGVLCVDGKEYIQKKGSVFYLAPGKPHEYRPADGDWVTNWIVFRGKYASELMKSMGFDGFKCAENFDIDGCGRIFRQIFSAASDPVNGGENASALVYKYVLAVRRSMFSDVRKSGTMNGIAEKAIVYISENYMTDISDEKLASLSGVSVNHFCRIFKAETSMRPLEYIAGRRIAEAKSLLVNTKLEIGEIGRRVGYEDRNYFSIVFRRTEGVSPREYRRAKGEVFL